MTLPPTTWVGPHDCPREECDETRFTRLGIELHLIHDHGEGGVRTVPEQVAETGAKP
jgi:hypothetical protein